MYLDIYYYKCIVFFKLLLKRQYQYTAKAEIVKRLPSALDTQVFAFQISQLHSV